MRHGTAATRQLVKGAISVLAGLGIVVSLSAATTPEAGSAGPSPEVQVVPFEEHPAGSIMDRDELTLAATAHIPGFGGAYVDPDSGALQVWMTGPSLSRARDAQRALAALSPGLADRPVAVRRADFAFAKLAAWRTEARELLLREGVNGVDIDERINRLVVMVTDRQAGDEVLRALAQKGVPQDAVEVVVSSPIRMLLRNEHRPLYGGTQIQFQTGPAGLFTATCTMGVTATRNGATGFMTNSHCSRTRSAVDDGRYWQPDRPLLDGNQVGWETVDPPLFVGGSCPEGAVCRYSDANFVQTFEGVGIVRAHVARPPLNSFNWNGQDLFRITSVIFAFPGDQVTKIGRTTGRTTGPVDRICVDANVEDTNIVMRCNDLALVLSEPGDSGSPVFRITHVPDIWDVSLVGILWGGGELEDGTQVTVFSPAPYAVAEVAGPNGQLLVCPAGFGC